MTERDVDTQPSSRVDQRIIDSVLRSRSEGTAQIDGPTTPACRVLAQIFCHFRVPVSPLAEFADVASLAELARCLGSRHLVAGREVDLGADWWKSSGEVLAVEHRRLGPCALIPQADRWWALQIVEDQTIKHVVDADFASECSPAAVEFMRVPPPGRNSIWALLHAGMFGLYSELLRRLSAAGAAACLAVVPPIMAAMLIDSVIPDGEIGGLIGVAGALLVTVLANSLLQGISGLAALRLDNALAFRVEAIVLTRELEGRHGGEPLPAGEILQRVSAVNWAMGFVTKTTQTVFVQALRGVANLLLLFTYSGVFGVVSLVMIGIYLLVLFGEAVIQYRMNRSAEAALGSSQEKSVQLLKGLSAARNQGIADRLVTRWVRDRSDYAGLEYRSKSVANLCNGVLLGIASGGLISIYALAAYGSAGPLSVGQIVASYGAFVVITGSLASLGTVLNTITSVLPIFARLSPLISRKEAFQGVDRPAALAGRFRAEEVELAPDSGGRAVCASFEIRPGELTVIASEEEAVGQHLLRVLVALHETRGQIEVDGQQLDTFDPQLLRRTGGVLVNAPRTLPTTLRRNLDLAGALEDDELLEALRQAGAPSGLEALPEGLETVLTGRSESQEFATQLAAARMFLAPRGLSVIADRSELRTTGWGQAFVEGILVREGTTRVVASTSPAVLARADRILVFDSRRGLIADGPPESLRASSDTLPWVIREGLQ
jgi:putative ABC transport system ATP-binding protein